GEERRQQQGTAGAEQGQQTTEYRGDKTDVHGSTLRCGEGQIDAVDEYVERLGTHHGVTVDDEGRGTAHPDLHALGEVGVDLLGELLVLQVLRKAIGVQAQVVDDAHQFFFGLRGRGEVVLAVEHHFLVLPEGILFPCRQCTDREGVGGFTEVG